MTLILDLDLVVLKAYQCTKNEVSRSMLSARTGQTDIRRQTRAKAKFTTPNSWTVIIIIKEREQHN